MKRLLASLFIALGISGFSALSFASATDDLITGSGGYSLECYLGASGTGSSSTVNCYYERPYPFYGISGSVTGAVVYSSVSIQTRAAILPNNVCATGYIFLSQVTTCWHITAGAGTVIFTKDTDGDGVGDSTDNCPTVYNPNQADSNGNGIGDVCDSAAYDNDGDGVNNAIDNCPTIINTNQLDTDHDGIGDACDTDNDNDGVLNAADKFPLNAAASVDTDGDGKPDSWNEPLALNLYGCVATAPTCNGLTLDDDNDNDGVPNSSDNCPLISNVNQKDTDGDGIGDACDTDNDNDGVPDVTDKFPFNPAASADTDGDGFPNSWNAACDATCQINSGLKVDNCPTVVNPDQKDTDGDGIGDACDPDNDNDGVQNAVDNCPFISNANQLNTDGDTKGDVCDPYPLTTELVGNIAMGYEHSCVLTRIGAVMCWGDNADGELGDNTTTQRNTPVDVVGLNSGVSVIASGSNHSCVLVGTGAVKCWGQNAFGEIGDNSTTQRNAPVDVVGLGGGVTAIAAGTGYTCVLTSAGAVKCWGYNASGQLGDNSTTNRLTPVDVVSLSSSVSAIEAGDYHVCVLTSASAVKCWGQNNNGQLGDNSTTNRLTPVNVVSLTGGITAIAAGTYHTCALTSVGGVKCWGANYYGQLGDNTTTQRNTPVDVVGLSSGVVAITAGNYHTCALTSTGAVKCWGYNTYGELGDNSATTRKVPVDVVSLNGGVSAIGAGGFHTCALTNTGAVKCWGDNYYGELGNNTTNNTRVPVNVIGLSGDSDGDGIGDNIDNCPLIANANQLDTDHDGIGDVCDTDDDNDGVPDTQDCYPLDNTQSTCVAGTYPTGAGFAQAPAGSYAINGMLSQCAVGTYQPLIGQSSCNADTICNANEYESTAPTLISDRICSALTICTADQFESLAPTTTSDRVCATRKQNDFDLNGKSDVLLRNTGTGDFNLAQLNGLTVLNQGSLSGALTDPDNLIVSTGDFNGDGTADILTRGDVNGLIPGAFHIDLMSGPNVIDSNWLLTMSQDLNDEVMSTKDFNKDGKADVLLRNKVSGVWTINYMNGTSDPTISTLNATLDTCYTLQGDGDYDGNGYPDLLLRKNHCGGGSYPWLMYTTNGTPSVLASGTLPGVATSANWGAVTTDKDFDGDGKADLLVRFLPGTTQQWVLYNLNGVGAPNANGLVNIALQSVWQFAAEGDFNADNKADLLLRNTNNGQWYIYVLNNTAVLSGAVPNILINPLWTLQATDDYDGDGKSDILIRNTSSGQWYMNLINGTTVQTRGLLTINSDLSYVLQDD